MKRIELNNDALIKATGSILVQALNSLNEPQAKVSTSMSVTFNMATATAATIMEGFDPMNSKYPTNDHVLLSLFLIHEGCSLNSEAAAHVEFSPMLVHEALEDFKKFTGRSGEHLINKHLMKVVKKVCGVKPQDFGPNSKFLPQ